MDRKDKNNKLIKRRLKNRKKMQKRRERLSKPFAVRVLLKLAVIIVAFFIISIVFIGITKMYVSNKTYSKYTISKTTINAFDGQIPTYYKEDNIENILLITSYGNIDNRDTVINGLSILSIDNNSNKIKRIELKGNVLIDINGIGEGKLSSVMKMGGKDFLIDTVKENLNLEISKYIAVNLNNINDMDKDKFERYITKINKEGTIEKYKFLNKSLKYITTNIKLKEALELISNISNMKIQSISTIQMPITQISSDMIYKELGMVTVTDLDQSKKLIHSFIFRDKAITVEDLDLYSAKVVLDKYRLEQNIYNDMYGF